MAAPLQSFPWGYWWWLAGKPSAGPSVSGPGPSRSSCSQWSRWVHGSGAALWRVQPGSMTCVASRGDKSCATWWSTRKETEYAKVKDISWRSLSSTHMETQRESRKSYDVSTFCKLSHMLPRWSPISLLWLLWTWSLMSMTTAGFQ